MNGELPQGWGELQLRDVCEVVMGQAPKGSECNTEGRGTVFVKAGEFTKDFPVVREWTVRPLKLAKKGDVLICVVGATCGKLNLGIDCAIGRSVAALRPSKVLLTELLYRQLQPMVTRLRFASTGSAQGVIAKNDLEEIPLKLPPLAEQQRIVAKLEKLLGQVDNCRQRLAKIPALLRRFRQSVRAAACSGRLTADWRDSHKAVRPARDTVQSLKTSDPETYLDIFKRSSDSEIPETWSWVCLGKLGPLVGGGTPSTGNPKFWNGSIPWVSPKDMKRSRIRDSEDHITELGLKSSSVSKIDPGAILFVVRGMILNHTLPTAITDVAVTLNQDMKALVPEMRDMSEYLSLAASHVAPSILFEVKEATHGTRRIESLVLKNWAIPLPPLEEQPEIVRRVESLFALADRLEARFAEGRKRVESITQAILAKAFRGELVPTEFELAKAEGRSFESAEELLERIRRNGGEKKPKGNGSNYSARQ